MLGAQIFCPAETMPRERLSLTASLPGFLPRQHCCHQSPLQLTQIIAEEAVRIALEPWRMLPRLQSHTYCLLCNDLGQLQRRLMATMSQATGCSADTQTKHRALLTHKTNWKHATHKCQEEKDKHTMICMLAVFSTCHSQQHRTASC